MTNGVAHYVGRGKLRKIDTNLLTHLMISQTKFKHFFFQFDLFLFSHKSFVIIYQYMYIHSIQIIQYI